MLVVNKSATSTLNSNITINGATPGSNGTAYSYGIAQDNAAKTGTGSADIAVTAISGLGGSFSYIFPAYSATVIAFGSTTPPPPPVRRPDELIKASSDASFIGNDVYSSDGTGETRSTSVKASGSGTFIVSIQNDGSAPDTFAIKGNGATSPFGVKYYSGTSGGTEITSQVTAGSYTVANLASGGTQGIRMVVTVPRRTAVGTNRSFLVTATSTSDATKVDAVKATVTSN
jgi:hypothetical protein